MGSSPPVPDDYELTRKVNEWTYDPDGAYNGHVWFGPDRDRAVVVAAHSNVRVFVSDERVRGMKSKQTIYEDDLDRNAEDIDRRLELEAQQVASAIDGAVEWMQSTAPSEWAHPRVSESIFDAPIGYEYDTCYVENRSTVVLYKQVGFDDESVDRDPETYEPVNYPYLYIHTWNGSGDATIALSPWKHADGPGYERSKWDIDPIADAPDGCGMEVALRLANEWAQEQVQVDQFQETMNTNDSTSMPSL